MLATYRQPHRQPDLAQAVRLCRENGMAVMLDLLLGGPGETPETLAESIAFFKSINPDCVGAALGVRIYPGTAMEQLVASEGPMETNPSIRRHYSGPIDLVQPTFYVASSLGERPAQCVRDLIAGDERFFPPEEESATAEGPRDHNYNANQSLCQAIAGGAPAPTGTFCENRQSERSLILSEAKNLRVVARSFAALRMTGALGATAGLSSSAGNAIAQTNRGTAISRRSRYWPLFPSGPHPSPLPEGEGTFMLRPKFATALIP